MQSHIRIDEYLYTIRKFQKLFPNAHVGGSIGLLLHRIDLKRSLGQSDIDMTIDEDDKISEKAIDFNEASHPEDFDICFRHYVSGNRYIKVDLRINPEPSFNVIEYNGELYNVSKLRDIIFWKQKYADKGIQKHIDDLVVISGKPRPEHKIETEDDLPF